MLRTDKGILVHLKQEGNAIVGDKVDGSGGRHPQCTKPAGEGQILHSPSYMRNPKQSNSEEQTTESGVWGRSGELSSRSHRVSDEVNALQRSLRRHSKRH